MVREPLIWLGEPDPVLRNKGLKSEDPEREKTFTVFKSIFEVFPNQWQLLKDIIAEAKRFEGITKVHPELYDALMAVGASRSGEGIDNGRLGNWLSSKKDVPDWRLDLAEAGRRRSKGTTALPLAH